MALSLSRDAYLWINADSFRCSSNTDLNMNMKKKNKENNAPLQVSSAASIKMSCSHHHNEPNENKNLEGIVTNTCGDVGEAFLSISSAPISLDALYSQFLLTSEQCGAVSTFLGVTRCYEPKPHGSDVGEELRKPVVVFLEYEAYSALALKVLMQLTEHVFKFFDAIHKVVVVHRIGKVGQREPGLFIGIASAHRRAALDAVSFAIEYVKKHLPVWKREVKYAANSEEEEKSIVSASKDSVETGFTSEWKHNTPVMSNAEQVGDLSH